MAHADACTSPPTDYGTDTVTVSVPLDSTYVVWSRLMPTYDTSTSYLLEVDGASCFNVGGDTTIPTDAWTWVNYQNGAADSPVTVSLTAGMHTLRLIGNAPDVMLDRVVLTADTTCIPIDTGENCANPPDTTPPTVSFTTPVNGATVSGTVNALATATDDVLGSGVSKVEFYVDGTLQSTVTTPPYTYKWDTTTVPNGIHSLMAKAYDVALNTSTASSSVTVQNADIQPPSTPTNLTATAAAYNKVNVSWTASTDNVGVTGYWVIRSGVTIAKVGIATTYSDTTVGAKTAYNYQVKAFDAANNTSLVSNTANVTTPAVPDTTPPKVPTNLKATVASYSQINLSWTASTDNVGVVSYSVYRGTGSATPLKLTTVTTTSYGDATLNPSTSYTYYVVATDAAGNNSPASAKVSATTPAAPKPGAISGIITSSLGGVVAGATVTLTVNNNQTTVTTNALGVYTIPNIPAANYTVSYAAKNYTTKAVSVAVAAGKTTLENIKLQHK